MSDASETFTNDTSIVKIPFFLGGVKLTLRHFYRSFHSRPLPGRNDLRRISGTTEVGASYGGSVVYEASKRRSRNLKSCSL